MSDSVADQAEIFWCEASMHFEQEQVKDACLTLQDSHGLNINLLLLAWWLAGQGYELQPEQFRVLDDAVRNWHDQQLRTIRQLRNAAKNATWLDDEHRQNLYQKLLDSELAMEKIEQRMLLEKLAALHANKRSEASARQSLWNYLLYAGVGFSSESQKLVARIANDD